MDNTSTVSLSPVILSNPVPLEAVTALFRGLHRYEIRYCHWKSNIHIDLGLDGHTDLDLLVAREQSHAFRQILSEHGIKPIIAPPGQRYPAMEHYLGFDPATGGLFHLHVHYQLVLGEIYVKNFRLPLEQHFLNSTRTLFDVIVPAPELELVILSVRAMLKYRDRDAVKDILSIRSSGIHGSLLKELAWLRTQTTFEDINEMLLKVADVIPVEIVRDFLATIEVNPRNGMKLLLLRQRLRRALMPYQRNTPFSAMFEYFREMWGRRKSFLKLSPTSRMTLPEGGLTLALVGADGSGKSTLCEMLAQWLSWKLDVHTYYLGSKEPSRRSDLLYMIFRVLRRSLRTVSGIFGEENRLADLRDIFLYLHHLSIGYDRYQRYRAGVKKVMSGSVVIFDRFPLNVIDSNIDSSHLDGPQIAALAGEKNSASIRGLIKAEQAIYRKFRAPDVLVVLNVSPQVSLQRKPDHKQETIRAKSLVIGELVKNSNFVQIDADKPLEKVFSQLKHRIWKVL